jgi:hypothetical protein
MIWDCHIPRTGQGARILLTRVFTKENTTFSLRQSSSPFFPQEFRPLILLKTKDRFTSLTVMRVKKIMCNNRSLNGFVTKWYIELKGGSFKIFNDPEMTLLTNYQLPI